MFGSWEFILKILNSKAVSHLRILNHRFDVGIITFTIIAAVAGAFEGGEAFAVHWEQVAISNKSKWVQGFNFVKFLVIRTYSRIVVAGPVRGATAKSLISQLVNYSKQLNCLRDIPQLDFDSNMREIEVCLYYTDHISCRSQKQLLTMAASCCFSLSGT